MKRTSLAIGIIALSAAALLSGQGRLDPAKLGQPPTDSWPTYHGDYSGRRYSTLTKINASNVNALSLAWVYRFNTGGVKQKTPLGVTVAGTGKGPAGIPLHADINQGTIYNEVAAKGFPSAEAQRCPACLQK